MKNEIILFEDQDVRLEVNLKDETVWLNAEQLSKLFGRDSKTIRKHIANALKEELDNSTVANFATVQKEGNRNITRNIDFYNLDMIISVGYRVKSKKGVTFRRWATNVLKEHLIQGYTANQKRLDYLEKTVKLIDIAGRIEEDINGDEAKEIFRVINNYNKALDLLDDYDHKRITKPKGNIDEREISYDNCKEIISMLKFGSDSNLFGQERNEGLKSIISTLYQTFGGKDLYPSIEEKAANFLYLITKNHTFIDGNKRIAATLFIYFLNFYDILYEENHLVIDNTALVALTLLIAQSNPKEKEIMIDLIMNFLNNEI